MYEWIIFLVLLIFVIGLWKKEAIILAISGSLMNIIGLFSMNKNLFEIPKYLNQSFSYVIVIFGIYIIIHAGIDLFYEEDMKLEMKIREWIIKIKNRKKRE